MRYASACRGLAARLDDRRDFEILAMNQPRLLGTEEVSVRERVVAPMVGPGMTEPHNCVVAVAE